MIYLCFTYFKYFNIQMILYGEMMLMGFLNLLVRERNRCQPNSNNSVKGQKIYFIDQKRCHCC
jgi:hypothetical protein